MNYKVDYHMHSWFSDGTMKPTELVKMYKGRDYDVIALTDHDGVDGVYEAVIAGEALELKVIPGIEIGSSYDFEGQEIELHILGYHIDTENAALKACIEKLRISRRDRNERLLAHLQGLGYNLVYEDLIERPGQDYIGKPNFARALKRKGCAPENMWDLFDEVPRERISAYEAIDIIKEAGGMAVLAHPLKTKKIGDSSSEVFWKNLDLIVADLKKHGLKGMECYHPSASHEQALKLVVMAGQYHLHITEGSDFHGDEE
ncbi:PHP domain-containing protein [Emergencia sp. 1XD21-10]|uniref:PHP domain-containing protein n=1 Tax=Emergencia sp. 1XD21-10 TaxID=2304569 RepID=UPI0013795CCC|nr:PHP domain-containing protein [Emergencia sp. 1XD21-10]NCF00208.1 PHP domain-containing protein [Emergencia sp. 1XD21-10]